MKYILFLLFTLSFSGAALAGTLDLEMFPRSPVVIHTDVQLESRNLEAPWIQTEWRIVNNTNEVQYLDSLVVVFHPREGKPKHSITIWDRFGTPGVPIRPGQVRDVPHFYENLPKNMRSRYLKAHLEGWTLDSRGREKRWTTPIQVYSIQ